MINQELAKKINCHECSVCGGYIPIGTDMCLGCEVVTKWHK